VIGFTAFVAVRGYSARSTGAFPRAMATFDQTYTDSDFERGLKQADSEWMAAHARREPDLVVHGLSGSLLSRLLALFTGRRP